VSGQLHAPDTLTKGKIPLLLMSKRVEWFYSRSGRFGEDGTLLPLPDSPDVLPVAQSPLRHQACGVLLSEQNRARQTKRTAGARMETSTAY